MMIKNTNIERKNSTIPRKILSLKHYQEMYLMKMLGTSVGVVGATFSDRMSAWIKKPI